MMPVPQAKLPWHVKRYKLQFVNDLVSTLSPKSWSQLKAKCVAAFQGTPAAMAFHLDMQRQRLQAAMFQTALVELQRMGAMESSSNTPLTEYQYIYLKYLSTLRYFKFFLSLVFGTCSTVPGRPSFLRPGGKNSKRNWTFDIVETTRQVEKKFVIFKHSPGLHGLPHVLCHIESHLDSCVCPTNISPASSPQSDEHCNNYIT